MKIFLISFIILLVSGLIKSNTENEQSTISNELENSNFAPFKDMEGQCYAYCFNIIQPVLEHTVSIQQKDKQIQEQRIIIKNLEKQLPDLQTKVGIYEETIKNKNEIIEKFEEIIKNKDLQLAEQLQASEKSENEIVLKLGICEETIRNKDLQLAQQLLTSEKCQNETIEKSNMIASRDEKIIEYKVKIENSLASSCIGKLTDVYEMKVPGIDAFSVPCDSSLAGSGWTVIQRRKDGSENFNRNWTDYRDGFGDLRGEFFIGLEKLHLLTRSQAYELYISLMDFENESRYALYSDFAIGSEKEAYDLKTLGLYSGNAGDSMTYHKNMKFSTPDRDHDTSSHNCAKDFSSGWWFHESYTCNLNGLYEKQDSDKTYSIIEWRGWKTDRPLKFTQMMIKPKGD